MVVVFPTPLTPTTMMTYGVIESSTLVSVATPLRSESRRMLSSSVLSAALSAAMSPISLREMPRLTLSRISSVVVTPRSAAMSASSSSSSSCASICLRFSKTESIFSDRDSRVAEMARVKRAA